MAMPSTSARLRALHADLTSLAVGGAGGIGDWGCSMLADLVARAHEEHRGDAIARAAAELVESRRPIGVADALIVVGQLLTLYSPPPANGRAG